MIQNYRFIVLVLLIPVVLPAWGQPNLLFFGQPSRLQKPANKTVVAVSPDERMVLFESGTGRLYSKLLTDATEPRLVFTSAYKLRCIGFSADGQQFVVADELNVNVFHVDTDQPRRQIPCTLATSVALSSDGNWLAVGFTHGSIHLIDIASGKIVRTLPGHSSSTGSAITPCHALCFSPTNRELVSAGADFYVKVWSVSNGRLLQTLRGHTGEVTRLSIRSDGRQVVSVSADNEFRIWDINQGKCVVVSDKRHLFDEVAFTADTNFVAAGYSGQMVGLWQLKPQERKAVELSTLSVPVRAGSKSPDQISRLQSVRNGLGLGLITSSRYYRIELDGLQSPSPVDSSTYRLALVIGNSDYPGNSLEGIPLNDARALKWQLEKIGFVVTLKFDVPTDSLRSVVSTFRRKIRRSTRMAVFYYAGHGLQLGDQNYILPVDMELDSTQIVRRALSVNQLTDSLSTARPQLSLLILDACRTTLNRTVRWPKGLLTQRGFRPILLSETTSTDTYIALSAEPGRWALNGCPNCQNSYYTQALLSYLKPGLLVEDVFRLTRAQVMKETHNVQKPELINRSNVQHRF